jgi:hypothetical protein
MPKSLIENMLKAKPWNISYDDFDLEITVKNVSSEHRLICRFKSTLNHKNAWNSIFRFFNEIVWFHQIYIRNISGGHSQGSHVYVNYNVNDDAYLLNFKKQTVVDERQHLALAFYREAKCNESAYYRFFCFYKILEIPFKKNKGKEKISWIREQLNYLPGNLAITFRDRKINSLSGMTLEDWLYHACRHAIAHAHKEEIVRDPNNYDDWDEIKWANTLMEDLARSVIIQKLGVKSI